MTQACHVTAYVLITTAGSSLANPVTHTCPWLQQFGEFENVNAGCDRCEDEKGF